MQKGKGITETMKSDLRGRWLPILWKPAVGQKLDEDLAKKKKMSLKILIRANLEGKEANLFGMNMRIKGI